MELVQERRIKEVETIGIGNVLEEICCKENRELE